MKNWISLPTVEEEEVEGSLRKINLNLHPEIRNREENVPKKIKIIETAVAVIEENSDENSIVFQPIKTPLGVLKIGVYTNKLVLCDWLFRKMRTAIDQRITHQLQTTMKEGTHPLIDQTHTQIQEYFKGFRTEFDVPLLLVGTPFQQQVWSRLLEIPYGKTLSYLELSRELENEKALRAVASANGANAISIIVPCHRVIGSDGALTGYAGGLQNKKKLLLLENAIKVDPQLPLFE